MIEVAIPLEAINAASAREKSIRHSHPSTLHLWWARRPLSAARSIIFCQLVDDPSSVPEEFPTEDAQEKERLRLFAFVSKLVEWENTNNSELIDDAKKEILRSWIRCCSDNSDHPDAENLFNPKKPPAFHDPFAGGGAIPLEAQRLGLNSFASDLNPIAVLINKAMIEIPQRFESLKAINPGENLSTELFKNDFKGFEGLANDIEYYGKWIIKKAKERIENYYPKIKLSTDIIRGRDDLNCYLNKELNVISWLWVRTVKSPNPSFKNIYVPLASSFLLSQKKGKEVYIEPHIEGNSYTFKVKKGKPQDIRKTKSGTKTARGANFYCLLSGDVINDAYIKSESMKKNLGMKLLAIVAEGTREKVYLDPLPLHEEIANRAKPSWQPDIEMNRNSKDLVSGRGYGFFTWSDLFTDRQLLGLSTFSDLIPEVIKYIKKDALNAGISTDEASLRNNGFGAKAYSEAIGIFLSFAISKMADRGSTICSWDASRDNSRNTFGRQAIPMTWDFAESNIFGSSSGSYTNALQQGIKVIKQCLPNNKIIGNVFQLDAQSQQLSKNKIISTDPPYYDNIAYADLSDYFYVWLRRALKEIYPELLATLTVPKREELVALKYRHGSAEKASKFFLNGMTLAMQKISSQFHTAFPATIYYAFKQSEKRQDEGITSTGWETFLESVITAGFTLKGTWPIRTELTNRMISSGTNALASSIVLVCSKLETNAPILSRSDFRRELREKLPTTIKQLEIANIAPVDLAQAIIGPGMSIFSSAKSILNPDDTKMSVGEALGEINSVLYEYLTDQETILDKESLFAITFFESFGYQDRPYGDAEGLAIARNLSVVGVVQAGIIRSSSGKVRLLHRNELEEEWEPSTDKRLCVWEAMQYLIIKLQESESSAAELLLKLKNLPNHNDLPSNCRSLAYRLYSYCEKTKMAEEAIVYNSLIISWPEIEKIAASQVTDSIQPSII